MSSTPSPASNPPPVSGQSGATPGRNLGDVLREFADHQQTMRAELAKVIVGQADTIEQLLAAIFTRGHCLLEGVPGLAKTLMVSTLADILDVSFKRIQFTPDLMPSDITGTQVLEEDDAGKRSFRFVQGPIFTNMLLADEINRTPPKTQAALLEAMQERQVTVGRDTLHVARPVFYDRHAKPHRTGRDLSVARGTVGPVYVQHQSRLSLGGRRRADPGDHDPRRDRHGQQSALLASDSEHPETGCQHCGQSLRDSLCIAAGRGRRVPKTTRRPTTSVNWSTGVPVLEPDRI